MTREQYIAETFSQLCIQWIGQAPKSLLTEECIDNIFITACRMADKIENTNIAYWRK